MITRSNKKIRKNVRRLPREVQATLPSWVKCTDPISDEILEQVQHTIATWLINLIWWLEDFYRGWITEDIIRPGTVGIDIDSPILATNFPTIGKGMYGYDPYEGGQQYRLRDLSTRSYGVTGKSDDLVREKADFDSLRDKIMALPHLKSQNLSNIQIRKNLSYFIRHLVTHTKVSTVVKGGYMSVMFDDGTSSFDRDTASTPRTSLRQLECPLFFTLDSQNHDRGPDFREEIDILHARRAVRGAPRVRLGVESAFRALNSRINRICGINELERRTRPREHVDRRLDIDNAKKHYSKYINDLTGTTHKGRYGWTPSSRD